MPAKLTEKQKCALEKLGGVNLLAKSIDPTTQAELQKLGLIAPKLGAQTLTPKGRAALGAKGRVLRPAK